MVNLITLCKDNKFFLYYYHLFRSKTHKSVIFFVQSVIFLEVFRVVNCELS